MTIIRPFRGLRCRPDIAAEVAALPYDVMNADEARTLADGKPNSFLHVSRPEIDLGQVADSYDPRCYEKAAENFQRMRADGVLIRDETPCLYLYRLTFEGRRQLGIAAEVSVDAYLDGRVKKHEFTRPDKEDDRTRHVEAIGANSGPVFLVYKRHQVLQDALQHWVDGHDPVVDVEAADGIRHEFWVVDEPDIMDAIVDSVEELGALYIADGHHRSAAGARVCEARRQALGKIEPDAPYNAFLGIMFPHDEVRVFDYNRVVTDLNGVNVDDFIKQVGEQFDVVAESGPVRPQKAGEFGMFIDDQWYRLHVDAASIPTDPVKKLDVSLLADRLLEPILGIRDPRTDKRIDFVGGIRGLSALEKRVASGDYAVAFSMYPTSLDDLMAVADAGEVMPPKSTWFEPKLRDGLICQLIDD